MPQLMGNTLQRACASKYEEVRRAQECVGEALAAVLPYKDRFPNKEAIYEMFPKAMEDARATSGPGCQAMLDAADYHAKAIATWTKWEIAEEALRFKKAALDTALNTLVTAIS